MSRRSSAAQKYLRQRRPRRKLQWIGLAQGGTFTNTTTGGVNATLVPDAADDQFSSEILVKRVVGNIAFVPQDALSDLTALGILFQNVDTTISGAVSNLLLPLAGDIDMLQQNFIKHLWVGVAQFGTASSGGVDVGWNYPVDLRLNFWVAARQTFQLTIQAGADGDLEHCANLRVLVALGGSE